MAELILDTQTVPSTPGAGVGKGAFDSVLLTWTSVDSNGNQHFYSPFWLSTTTGDFTGTNVNTPQPVFNTTEDVITLPATSSFRMTGIYHIHTTGTTSHQLGILFGGTATLTSIGYSADSTNAATEVTGAGSRIWIAVATVINITPATATATHHTVQIDGIVRTNAGGTFIPQYQWSAAPGVAGVTLANSFIQLEYMGLNTRAAVGPWA